MAEHTTTTIYPEAVAVSDRFPIPFTPAEDTEFSNSIFSESSYLRVVEKIISKYWNILHIFVICSLDIVSCPYNLSMPEENDF